MANEHLFAENVAENTEFSFSMQGYTERTTDDVPPGMYAFDVTAARVVKAGGDKQGASLEVALRIVEGSEAGKRVSVRLGLPFGDLNSKEMQQKAFMLRDFVFSMKGRQGTEELAAKTEIRVSPAAFVGKRVYGIVEKRISQKDGKEYSGIYRFRSKEDYEANPGPEKATVVDTANVALLQSQPQPQQQAQQTPLVNQSTVVPQAGPAPSNGMTTAAAVQTLL